MKKLNKEDINIHKWEFEFQQRGEHPVLLADWYCRSFDRYWGQTFQLDLPAYDYILTSQNKGYAPKKLKEQYLQKLKIAIDDQQYLDRLIERSVSVMQEFDVFVDKLMLVQKDAKPEELARIWKELDGALLPLYPWFWAPYYVSEENMVTDKVQAGLEKHKSVVEKVCDLDTALFVSIFPTQELEFQKEQTALSVLANYVQSHPNYRTDGTFLMLQNEYLQKFDWLSTFLLMPLRPRTKEQLEVRIEDAIENKLPLEYEKQQQVKLKNTRLAEDVLRAVQMDATLVSDIHNARRIGYALTAGVETALRSMARCLPFLEQVSREIGVVYEDIKYLCSSEIHEALRGVPIGADSIALRKGGYVMMVENGEVSTVFGNDAADIATWIDVSLTEPTSNTTTLKGQIACKGLVTGRVRLAVSPTEAHLLVEGEILVCPMTNPDYVPAMRRSGAIVTDEGGLLSHAAIMSREFNKPCVIATKVATKVLKTGDKIEVDANTGIVKILERASE